MWLDANDNLVCSIYPPGQQVHKKTSIPWRNDHIRNWNTTRSCIPSDFYCSKKAMQKECRHCTLQNVAERENTKSRIWLDSEEILPFALPLPLTDSHWSNQGVRCLATPRGGPAQRLEIWAAGWPPPHELTGWNWTWRTTNDELKKLKPQKYLPKKCRLQKESFFSPKNCPGKPISPQPKSEP